MLRVTVRLHGDLGRFAGRRDVVVRALPAPTTTEDLVESVGVPHPEVERLLVNGEPSPFGRLVADGDEVAVVPHAPGAAEGLAVPLRPPLGEPRFVLDGHLGRLAGYLRMLGFDTLYEADADDEALAATSAGEERALLTRDIGLLKRSAVVYGRFLRSDNPERQLAEVVACFGLAPSARPFTRCMRCNGELEPVPKAEVEAGLQPLTRRHYEQFVRCRACGRVFWPGSHHERMRALVARVLGGG